jgi:hypothetical protein
MPGRFERLDLAILILDCLLCVTKSFGLFGELRLELLRVKRSRQLVLVKLCDFGA